MKRTLITLMAGALFGALVCGLASQWSADAAEPSTQPAQTTPAVVPVSGTTPAPAAVPSTKIAVAKSSPGPETEDAVLGTRRWGWHSEAVSGARGRGVTGDLHSDVEGYESDLLTRQQSSELLDIFRDSRGVRRIIRAHGGDPDDAAFYVKTVQADEDTDASSVPWVTATLRADFSSPEGKRGLEMQVYRQKIRRGEGAGLDNTPYVELVQVGKFLDVVSCNEYVGWYDGLPEKIDTITWQTLYEKPFILERKIGADAQADRHGDDLTRFTEEYQANVYRRQVAMFRRIPFLNGTIAWVLVDFRSPRRPLAGIQDFYNRKGLFSDRGERKSAFFILRDYYKSMESK